MERFTGLLSALDQKTSTSDKKIILKKYLLEEEDERNKLWTIALLCGNKPSGIIASKYLRFWTSEKSNIPLWLFEETYYVIGDLAETISLVLPQAEQKWNKPLYLVMEEILSLKKASESDKQNYILTAWSNLGRRETWVFNKIITGGFRIGVSKNLVFQVLSETLNMDLNKVTYLFSGKWSPLTHSWKSMLSGDALSEELSKPYPFHLAYGLTLDIIDKIQHNEWVAEWKWDGIRGQLIKREGNIFLWSRGEELITESFPEFLDILQHSEDFVIDGEIVPWKDGAPMAFNFLQKRISRKNPGKKIREEIPVRYIMYDIMEYNGKDIREEPFAKRRKILEDIMVGMTESLAFLSPILPIDDTKKLDGLRRESFKFGAEGLVVKRKAGKYHTGRKRGDMWKWKKDPYTVDAVLIYAQRGHGRRASLFSDFTFAVWDQGQLVPVMKAYSGLTDVEMSEITRFVRKNTIATFGPVSSVNPVLVFEIAFEGVAISGRHKSGVAVRFPRILRWRKDKEAQEADTIDQLKSLIS